MKTSREVTQALQEARAELSPFLREWDFQAVSRYNMGYMKYAKDPTAYFIDAEFNRFVQTVCFICSRLPQSARVLDIGVFIPVVPIALAKLGYQVEAIEKLALYGNTLDKIIAYVDAAYKIRVHDLDIVTADVAELGHQFDVILLMAILEHLNGSPRQLLDKCRSLLKPTGCLLVEVPNIATLAKRLSFLLKGKSPLPDYPEYFSSAYPFEGHNREYNLSELRYALQATGFDVKTVKYTVSGLLPGASLRSRLLKALTSIGPQSWSDVIWVAAQAKQ